MNKKTSLWVCLLTTLAITGAIVVSSSNRTIQSLSVAASNNKSFTFDQTVGDTYFKSNYSSEKTISTGISSDIKAGVSVRKGANKTSDLRFGGEGYFLEKYSWAMQCDFNFLIGVNNITSFSLSFRMVDYSYVLDPTRIDYNAYLYLYDSNYNVGTALSEIAKDNYNYVTPIYSSDNLGSSDEEVEKNKDFTVSWVKPSEASYTGRFMRLYFSLSGADKDTYAYLRITSITVNWEC